MDKTNRDRKVDDNNAEPLIKLPTESDFQEMLSRDVPLQTSSCEMNYSVYHQYSRSC